MGAYLGEHADNIIAIFGIPDYVIPHPTQEGVRVFQYNQRTFWAYDGYGGDIWCEWEVDVRNNIVIASRIVGNHCHFHRHDQNIIDQCEAKAINTSYCYYGE